MNDSKLHPLAVLGRADHAEGCLKGYCRTTYGTLVALLGEPHVHRGDKTTVEWAIRCHDGTVFTVYDWEELITPLNEYHWHIGGTGRSLDAFTRYTGLETIPFSVEQWTDAIPAATVALAHPAPPAEGLAMALRIG